MTKKSAQERREKYKNEYWPNDIPWTGERPEKGWFRAPRTLPLILALLSTKTVSGKTDPTSAYLELLARHRDGGVVEMVTDADHSFAAGYTGSRGIRTWQERMKLLEQLGFIKSVSGGNQTRKFVLLVHPSIAVKKLHEAGKVNENWWTTYRHMQIEMKETMFEQLIDRAKPKKADAIKSGKRNTNGRNTNSRGK